MQLARSGAMVLSWDLVGWGDTLGDHELPDTKPRQIRHGLEILQFLKSLDHLDSERIGLVGFSGGAHLGIYLSALDSSIQTRVLASMVSTLRVGNCNCELLGYPYHSVAEGTDNVELCALFEPRSQLLISNGQDWTRHFPEIGLKTIQKIYSLSENPANLESTHLQDHGHAFSNHHRQLTYRFLERALKLNFARNQKGEVEENWIPQISEELLRAPR